MLAKRAERGLVDDAQRQVLLCGYAAAGFVFRRKSLLAVGQGSENTRDWSKTSLDLVRFSRQTAAVDCGAAAAERAGFLKENLFEPVGVGQVAEDAEQHARATFLHLNRGRKHIECSGFKKTSRAVADDFAGDVV